MSRFLKKIAAAFLFGGIAVACIYFLLLEQGEVLKSFCNAFSVVGVAFLTLSAFDFLQINGAFLGLGYTFQSVKAYLFPLGKEQRESYGEYRARKEKDKKSFSRWHFLAVGGLYLLVAFALI